MFVNFMVLIIITIFIIIIIIIILVIFVITIIKIIIAPKIFCYNDRWQLRKIFKVDKFVEPWKINFS